MFLLHFGFGRLKICYFELTFVITRFILYSFKNLKSLIGIAIDVIVIEDLEVKWSRSTCVFNLIIGIWGIGLVFHCYLDLDLQWIGLNCWGWVRVADWLFIFWIHLNWLSLQTIAFVFLFILEMVQLYHYKLMDISEWIAMGGSIRCEEMWVLKETLESISRSLENLQYSFAAFFKIEMKSTIVAVLWWCGHCSSVKCNPCLAEVWSGIILEWNKAIYLSISLEFFFANFYSKLYLLAD